MNNKMNFSIYKIRTGGGVELFMYLRGDFFTCMKGGCNNFFESPTKFSYPISIKWPLPLKDKFRHRAAA